MSEPSSAPGREVTGPESLVVPPLPPVPDRDLAAHVDVHGRMRERLNATSPAARTVFVHLARRLVVEALANLQPTWVDPRRPRLVPPPRTFLDDGLMTRRRGAAEAFRYLDTRLSMVRLGALPGVIDHAVPEVLNALLQAAPRSSSASDETNPGLIRATSTWWPPDVDRFAHPPAEQCQALLQASVDLARDAPAPAVARAGWLALVVNTVHPFVDGNGRTFRALAFALASSSPTGIDWGMLEQWNLDRIAYIDALAAGRRGDRYSVSNVDPGPFMDFTVRTSIRGAEVSLERLALVERIVDELRLRGASDLAARAIGVVVTERFVPLADLLAVLRPAADDGGDGDDGPSGAAAHDLVVASVRDGWSDWADAPPGRPGGRGLVPGRAVADLADVCVDAVATASTRLDATDP